MYLVLDYSPKGDLSFQWAKKGVFTEDEVRIYIAELILGIEHLHSMSVIYRDLKPENLLLNSKNNSDIIKVIDFGTSQVFSGEEKMT